MSRHLRRVQYLERRFLGGPAVSAIVRSIEQASDEELEQLIASGELEAKAQRLSDGELARLIKECERLLQLEQLKDDENVETTRMGLCVSVGVEPQPLGTGDRLRCPVRSSRCRIFEHVELIGRIEALGG